MYVMIESGIVQQLYYERIVPVHQVCYERIVPVHQVCYERLVPVHQVCYERIVPVHQVRWGHGAPHSPETAGCLSRWNVSHPGHQQPAAQRGTLTQY